MKSMTHFFLSLCILILVSGTATARTIKIATAAPDGTTWMKEMQKGAKNIEAQTQGRVKLKFYPGGVMGNDKSVHRKIRAGQLHGGAFTAGSLAHIYQDIQIYSLPMLFKSFDEVDYVRSKMDMKLKQGMEDNGYVLLGISEGGFARILSNTAVHNLAEIRATKTWVPEGDALVQESFNTLGISPISLPLSDVFTGLQTGLLDTISANPTAVIAFQWHTKVSHLIDVPLIYITGTLAIGKKVFDKISKSDQVIVKKEMGNVFKILDKLNRTDNKKAHQALQNQGIKFVVPDNEEIVLWESLAEKATANLINKGIVSRTMVDEVMQHLQDYRSTVH